jgi:hypothetical protein
MPSDEERRAAFKAVQEQVKAIIPDMFEGYVTDEHIWVIADSALWAAEAARGSKALAEMDKKPGGG